MKKLVALLLCLCLAMSVSAVLAEDYTAEAMGRNDLVKVTVTYADGKIEAITAEHTETPGIGDIEIPESLMPFEKMPEA